MSSDNRRWKARHKGDESEQRHRRYQRRPDVQARQAKALERMSELPVAYPPVSASSLRLVGLTHEEILRDRRLLVSFGLTFKEWRAIFEAQGERCAVCGAEEPGVDHGWATDHDHRTGLVRGILCNRCNSALGVLGDTQVGIAVWSSRFLRYLQETAPRTREVIEATPDHAPKRRTERGRARSSVRSRERK